MAEFGRDTVAVAFDFAGDVTFRFFVKTTNGVFVRRTFVKELLKTASRHFARNRINISKIESRPLRARPWEYLFFVDLMGHREDPKLARALKALERKALFLKVLGSYPEGRSAAA